MVNTSLLNSYIKKSGLKRKHIAEKMGLSSYGLANKINGKTSFNANEIAILVDILSISKKDVFLIFLTSV